MRILLLMFSLLVLFACSTPKEKKLDRAFYKTVGFQIREQRLLKDLTQQEFADEVGLTQNGLSLIEDGLATPIHSKLISIQDYLGVVFKIEGKYERIEDYLDKK